MMRLQKCDSLKFKDYTAMLQHLKSIQRKDDDWWNAMYYDHIDKLYNPQDLATKKRKANKQYHKNPEK